MLDGIDCINLHRANGALLVTTHDSMPLFFCTEESSWWGRLFLGWRPTPQRLRRQTSSHLLVRHPTSMQFGASTANDCSWTAQINIQSLALDSLLTDCLKLTFYSAVHISQL